MRRIVASLAGLAALFAVVAATSGCESLDGRNRIRKGNRLFKDSCFVQSVGEYEKALTEVDDPIVHYNLGLALGKVLGIGHIDKAILLDTSDSLTCSITPNTTTQAMRACVAKEKEHKADEKCADARFTPCDEKNVCPSSQTCEQVSVCAIMPDQLAGMVTDNFGKWLDTHQDDAETRALMTQVWLNTDQYQKALDYWNSLLQKSPNDPAIMGSLAGIELKAGDWRKSIDWYLKVAQVTPDTAAKINAFEFIGRVGWAKLNSRTLTPDEAIELSDRAIGALQKAAELSAQAKYVGLQASIFNFRSQTQGASFAAAADRATAQDLQHRSRVLSGEAKKAQGQPVPATPAGSASGSGTGSSGSASGSAGSATPAGSATTPPHKTGG